MAKSGVPVVLGMYGTMQEAETAAELAGNIASAMGRETLTAQIRYSLIGLVGPKINGHTEVTASDKLVCGFGDNFKTESPRGLSQHYRQKHRGRRPK